MAATRARTELAAAASAAAASSPPTHNAKDVVASREAAPVDPAANDQTPARRATTRTRKLPSRLLPSPSPPPSRPSSLYNAAKHAKGGKDGTDSTPVSPVVPLSTSSAAVKMRKSAKPDADSTGSDLDSTADKDDAEDLGPGKRKRRPSSMYKPPSTLTTVETPSPASTLSSSRSKRKGRSISPEASTHKGQYPSVAVAQAKLKGRLSKGRLEVGTPLSKNNGTQDGLFIESNLPRANGDDSDAEPEAAARSTSKRVRIGDVQEPMDLSPPPLLPRDGSARIQMPMHYSQPTFIRGGRVSVSPEASAKRPVKFGTRVDEPDMERSRIGSIMRASKADTRSAWKHSDLMSSSPVSTALAKFDNDIGAPLTYVPLRTGTRGAVPFRNLHTNPFANPVLDEEVEDDDEDDEDDDENDFHQAMLDADFDFFDSQKSEVGAAKVLWPASRRGTTEEAEMDDTPATTPRSPQSGCDLPSPGSPHCKVEEDLLMTGAEDKATPYIAGRDSVFVHALPTTQVGADKPHQHAGSLTLSLPYDPAVAVSSPQLRAMNVDSDAVTAAKGVKDATANAQMDTPILQRRKHTGLPAGPHALSPLKLGADLMERSTSTAAPYMQLSPMIEMDSPLLSPGLTLSLHTKGTDLPSPFIMGVGALPDLEQPVPLDLPPPAEGSTTPKASSPEIVVADVSVTDSVQSTVAVAKPDVVTETLASKQPEVKVVEAAKEATVSKTDKPSARRPALPPPRQIRFTTFTTPSVDSAEIKPQQSEASKKIVDRLPTQQQQITQHQASAGGESTTSPKSEITPELVHSGSASPDSVSDSPSPLSQADSTSTADAEVENILFGPPEKLDLHELDHAWGGSKAAQHEAALRRAQVAQMPTLDVDTL
ncbi:hypothetical protein EX895_000499 [Sporisorium graminicola]|uniref:Uncharacterized protein n=1 Tax=Sporisorium graminicola TaxID=280036 RepID=A0A4U7KZZ6_9BASI|nr:hypothetical protein EX895_000499 [Sporisorium graminicola]TKY90501.1 hypothetical protein EX895_000499 [Sporisorium graminicola]